MSSISFGNIYLLFLIFPLLALFVVPFALAVGKSNRNGHNIASICLHAVMAVLLAFAATTPTYTKFLTETHVYVLADVSYSTSKNLDTIDNYIKDLKLPEGAQLGLVAFGKDIEVLNRPGNPARIKSVKRAHVDTSESNIVGALQYTGSLFKGDVVKRIVLITDGRATDAQNSNSIKNAIDRLGKDIRVDVIYLDSNIKEGTEEVQLSHVEYTSNAYRGNGETATAVVQAGAPTSAIVTLYKGEEEIGRRAVNLSVGVNNVSFDLDTSAAGSFDYRVVVEADKDTSTVNNACSFTQQVTETLRVLFVTGKWEDVTAAVTRYGERSKLDIYENDRTVASFLKNVYVNQHPEQNIYRDNTRVPFSVEALMEYDEIVISNVDITSLGNYTEFVRSVDTVVSLYGKSLVTVGNLNVQNGDAAELKQLEDMLPVRYGNREEAPKVYTLVFDASRSMESNFHMVVAKQVSKKIVENLHDEDRVCIVTFYGNVKTVLEPTPLTDRDYVNGIIDGIDVTQGTVIGAGLSAAYALIDPLDYSEKQVMLITDGLSYSDERDDPVTIATEMYDAGIVTSVFDVGRQGDSPSGDGSNPDSTAVAARNTLLKIAEEGHGNYYYSNNSENLPDIVFNSLADSMTETVIERETAVNVAAGYRRDEVLSGFDLELPKVSGYVYGTAKASASTVLTVAHARGRGTVDRPLYAYWKYGNGRVSTFMSGFAGAWLAQWGGDEDLLFDNVLTTNIPAEKHTSPYLVSFTQEGKYVSVELIPDTVRFGAEARLEITLPGGGSMVKNMTFASSYYYTSFETGPLGKYEINVIYNYNGLEYADLTVLHVDYPPEYDEFAVYESAALRKAVDGRGSFAYESSLDLSLDAEEVGKISAGLTLPLIIACVVLFIVDIVVRKLWWKDVVSFFGFNKNGGGKK